MENQNKKMACPYDYFNNLDDYQKPVNYLIKEDLVSNSKMNIDKEIARTKEIFRLFNIKNGEQLINLFLKRDLILLTCVFGKFLKISTNDFGVIPLFSVNSPGYTWQCCFKFTAI